MPLALWQAYYLPSTGIEERLPMCQTQ